MIPNLELHSFLYKIYSFFILGHNFVGVFSFCGGMLYTAITFIRILYGRGNAKWYEYIIQFPIAWFAIMPLFRIMDLAPIPFILYHNNMSFFELPHSKFNIILEIIGEFTFLYLVRDRVHWKRLFWITPLWIMYAFYVMCVFGTVVGLKVPPDFDIVSYWLFTYIPLWVSYFWFITLFVKKPEECSDKYLDKRALTSIIWRLSKKCRYGLGKRIHLEKREDS